MRTLNSTAQALLARLRAGEQIPLVQLVWLDLEVEWRITTAGVPLVWDGHTWDALGVTVSPIEDDAQELPGLTLGLPAVTEAQLALALTEDVEGCAVRVYDAIVDPDTGAVADAVLAWAGVLETPGIEDGAVATLAVQVEHRGSVALRPKPSRYTDAEQQRLYPGDTSLQFDPATDAAPLAWPAAAFFKQ